MPSRTLHGRRFGNLLALTLFALAPAARADLLPEDGCTTVGQQCSTAPPDFHQPGVCQERTCTRTVPEADGALQQMQYSCPRCVGSGGNAGGHGGAGGIGGTSASGGARDAGGPDGAPDAGDPEVHTTMNCNCFITPARTANTTAATMFVTGLLALLKGRRSRRS